MTEAIASLEDVSKNYDNGQIIALQNISLQISRGEFLAISGPSGSGKSTLLNLLCGLDRPTTGKVFFEGKEPQSLNQWGRIRAKRIGFIFQAFFLFPTLTVMENLEIPMFGVESSRKVRQQKVFQLLSQVKLENRAKHLPNQLSGGERQRVAIARSMANSPDLILADEPTGSLDSKTSEQILELLVNLRFQDGASLVVVTHENNIAASADRCINILDGQISTHPLNE